jgi:hypothetical protein
MTMAYLAGRRLAGQPAEYTGPSVGTPGREDRVVAAVDRAERGSARAERVSA